MATWQTGDTESIVITVTEDDVNVSSLAGATVDFAIYDSSGSALVTKTTADFTASAPTFTCVLDDDDLDGISTGVYSYEVRVTDASGRTQSGSGTMMLESVTL